MTNECGLREKERGSVRSDEDGEREIASNPINIFIKSLWFYALRTHLVELEKKGLLRCSDGLVFHCTFSRIVIGYSTELDQSNLPWLL